MVGSSSRRQGSSSSSTWSTILIVVVVVVVVVAVLQVAVVVVVVVVVAAAASRHRDASRKLGQQASRQAVSARLCTFVSNDLPTRRLRKTQAAWQSMCLACSRQRWASASWTGRPYFPWFQRHAGAQGAQADLPDCQFFMLTSVQLNASNRPSESRLRKLPLELRHCSLAANTAVLRS